MKLTDLLVLGAAPNPVQNATLPEARAMGAHLGAFATILGKFVCTTEPKLALGALVPVESVEPPIPDDVELNLHLLLQAPGREIPFSVAIWHGTVSRWGPRKATAWILDVLNPAWREDGALLAKVDELADVPPAPAVVTPDPTHLPPAPAMPNWLKPIGAGWLAVRVGDTSPAGTKFIDPEGNTWLKTEENSMFNSEHKGTARWEVQRA